ncbi:Nif3-like dinuclear metal center hexameric protein [Abyssisolibacter fermentans]|uniref:Nif3-like dinuclear metal center hexameric protein n=1 Tax=Abyssisolibacter fermentans TaxID=1766203 RepID=UPI000834BE29|nr:Nif3-like dinuclear metal center hexameric protein [Abyssisolibacter fermentans]
MKVKKICDAMNKLAPVKLAEKWDNCGLQIGNPHKEVKKILLALDATEAIVTEAVKLNYDMIITHHPFIFKPLNSIDLSTYKGRLIKKLINNDIAIYSSHTNLDACKDGVNDVLSKVLDLKDVEILDDSSIEKFLKIIVYVPTTHAEALREKLNEAGAGDIGNYSHCSFTTEGIGTFMPKENTNPFIGEVNRLEKVNEAKIETIIHKTALNNIIDIILKNHPYEEPAYDIYQLENKQIISGIGRIGYISKTMTLEDLAKFTNKKLRCTSMRVYGDLKRAIKRVAVCGGSGASYITLASAKGADVLITGDIRSFEAQQAYELGIAVIDAEHYNTERVVLKELQEYLHRLEKEIHISISNNDNNAQYYII